MKRPDNQGEATERTLRWAILGAGDVAEVKSGPGFQRAAGSSLVAVMRRDSAKAEDFARRHGVPKWYDRAEDLLADPEVDAVYIATPPRYHLGYAKDALRAGKHVYVEKPMTLNAAEAHELIAAEDAAAVRLVVAHYRRRLPYFLRAKELLESGIIGRVRRVELAFLRPAPQAPSLNRPWRLDPALSGGGLFHDIAPHHFDLLLALFGRPLSCSGASTGVDGEPPDRVAGTIRFSNEILFHGAWDFAVPPDRAADRCTVLGEAGWIEFGLFEQCLRYQTEGEERVETFPPIPHVQEPMIAAATAHFLGNAPCPCSSRDGLAVMELIDAFTSG